MRCSCFTHALRMLYENAFACVTRALLVLYSCFTHALLMLYSCFMRMRCACFTRALLMLYHAVLLCYFTQLLWETERRIRLATGAHSRLYSGFTQALLRLYSGFTQALWETGRRIRLAAGAQKALRRLSPGFTQALLRLYYALPLGALGENEGIAWQLAQSLQGPQRP